VDPSRPGAWGPGIEEQSNPETMGYVPVLAITKIQSRLDMTINDFDVVDLNDVFAAHVVAVARRLDPERINPNCGATALGHPVEAAGAVFTVKLLNGSRRRDSIRSS